MRGPPIAHARHFIGQGQRIADNLARQSTLALLFHSPENAREVVSATLAFPDVSACRSWMRRSVCCRARRPVSLP
jgi:hypothetical protein